MRQLGLALLDLGPEDPHLVDDARVLFGHAVDRIDAVEQVVEARRAEKNLERALLTRRVEGDEPRGEVASACL